MTQELLFHHRGAEKTDDIGAFVVGPLLMEGGAPGGPLSGLSFAVKDLLDVRGALTGAGNPTWLEDAEPATANAPAVQALLDAGADLIGKTLTDELAFSLSGTNVHYGTPINVEGKDRVPGGSSAGSAAAVAANLVPIAIGTDTGGSIRIPSSYCGIYGLRPSHGRIDCAGTFLLAPSFCTTGLFARSSELLQLAWRALLKATSPTWQERPVRPITSLVVSSELFSFADSTAQEALERETLALAERLSMPVTVQSFGDKADFINFRSAFRTIQMYEAWQQHGEWITRRAPNLGPGVASRFRAASQIDPETLPEAYATREDLKKRFAELMGEGSILVQPVTSGVAPLIELDEISKEDLRLRTLALASPGGLAGSPTVVVPGARVGGLPVGLGLVGLPGDDDVLIDLAVCAEGKVDE